MVDGTTRCLVERETLVRGGERGEEKEKMNFLSENFEFIAHRDFFEKVSILFSSCKIT